MKNKEHLSQQGLEEIIAIRASINKGLAPTLKTYLTNINPIQRP